MRYPSHNAPRNVVLVLLFVLLASTAGWARQPAASSSEAHLENDHLAVTIDRRTGGVRAVTNKAIGQTHQIDAPGFLLELGTGKKEGSLGRITPADCTVHDFSHDQRHVKLVFEKRPVRITVTYRLDPADHFVEKRVRVDYLGKGPFNVSRLEMFDWKVDPPPRKAIPYYGYLDSKRFSQFSDHGVHTPSDNSIANFLRYGEGGLFTLVSCDFVLMHQDKPSGRYRSTYWPGQILPAGTSFLSEKGLIGVYRRKGRFFSPYRPTKALQDFLLPNVDAALDRAEIEAVQAAVQKYLKPEVYIFLANGWALDLPYQLNTAEAARKFKAAIDNIKRFPQMEALHFIDNFCGLSAEFAEHAFDMPIEPNPHAVKVFEYAKRQGMGLSMFIWTSRRQRDLPTLKRKELLTLDDQGKRMPDAVALTRQYGDFIFNTVSKLRAKYPHIKGLTYDFMDIWPDFDPEHGYLPGRGSMYAQWANIRDTNRRIRRAFPDLMLRYQIGWRSLGPWLAEHASFCHNAHDPNIENQRNFLDFHVGHQFANNYRLGSWYANNCKMFPRYMMNAFVVHKTHSFDAWDYGSWEYCVMSRMAAGCGFGMLSCFPNPAEGEVLLEEQTAFLDKWITWQRSHKDYYVRERELFGEPSPANVDGYAYGNGRDSVVFVCNPTFRTKTVAVPIDGLIHLPKGGRWTVRELYPEARYRVGPNDGLFDQGSRFVTRIPPQTVCLFEVKPYKDDQSLLLGVEGRLSIDKAGTAGSEGTRKIVLSDLRGPTGAKRLVAVRLPKDQVGPVELVHKGRILPARRSGDLLLAAVQFDGETIQPEVAKWRATRKGKRLKIRATIDVPRDAKGLLEHRRETMPVAKKYDTPYWLGRTAWLGPGRFIIHLPVALPGMNMDPFRGPPEKILRKIKRFGVTATLNGKPIDVHSNIMGLTRCRWSGFFIDASKAIRYGQPNELVLDLPLTDERGFHGIYLPNLTPQYTDKVTVLDPPARVTLVDTPDATDAYPPVPKVVIEGDRIKAWIELRVTAQRNSILPRDAISIENGTASGIRLLDDDPRWAVGRNSKGKPGLLLGSTPKRVRLAVEGTSATRVRLGTDPKASCTFTLGEAIAAWRARNDRFEPLALELPWPARQATVKVDFVAPPEKKRLVQEDL
ncbi:MAG: hypothetical protein JW818_06585 [Pirellulales bacterium]|nr:hypothetical protein [Pirellulales bacterium]